MSTLQLKDFLNFWDVQHNLCILQLGSVGRAYFSFENSRAATAEEVVQNSPFMHLDGISEVQGLGVAYGSRTQWTPTDQKWSALH